MLEVIPSIRDVADLDVAVLASRGQQVVVERVEVEVEHGVLVHLQRRHIVRQSSGLVERVDDDGTAATNAGVAEELGVGSNVVALASALRLELVELALRLGGGAVHVAVQGGANETTTKKKKKGKEKGNRRTNNGTDTVRTSGASRESARSRRRVVLHRGSVAAVAIRSVHTATV